MVIVNCTPAFNGKPAITPTLEAQRSRVESLRQDSSDVSAIDRPAPHIEASVLAGDICCYGLKLNKQKRATFLLPQSTHNEEMAI